MSYETELKTLDVGSEFRLAGYDWIVLDHDRDGTTLIVTKDSIGDRSFDDEGSNDFRNSSIRKFLNTEFLEDLFDDGLSNNSILYTDFDLSDSSGGSKYGVCRDRVGLLTEKQYELYRDLLELDDWWWLITPYAGYSRSVRLVDTGGALNYNNAYYGNDGVRPALSLDSSTLIETIKVIQNTENCSSLDDYSNRELLEELLIRLR